VLAIQQVKVSCLTTASPKPVIFEIKREWAPIGAKRFLDLVEDSHFTNASFFRVVPGFLVQWGIAATKAQFNKWQARGLIEDDPLQKFDFKRGMLAFAGSGTNSRGTQIFVAYADSKHLGKSPWETAIGFVSSGMETLDALYNGYGDSPPWGKGPDQHEIFREGNAYLSREFPLLDHIISCKVVNKLPGKDQSKGIESIQDDSVGWNSESNPSSLFDFISPTLLLICFVLVVLVFVPLSVTHLARPKQKL